MDEITMNLVVLAATLALIAAVFWWTRRRQANQESALRRLAAERGWQYQTVRGPLHWGFRMTAPRWTLEALSHSADREAGPGSINIAQTTRWQAQCAGVPVLIGPRLTAAGAGGEIGQWLAGQIVAREMGSEAAGLKEIEGLNGVVYQRYSLWARSPADLEPLLIPQVVSILLNWSGKEPVIRRVAGTLQIEIQGERYTQVEKLNTIVQLGEALLPGA